MALRVLIVDDSAITLQVISAALLEAGFEPVGASDLAPLSASIQSGPFHAIVLAVKMPEALGEDLTELLGEVRGAHVPVVLFSDMEEAQLAARARALGAEGYVSKSGGGVLRLTEVLTELRRAPSAPKPGRRVMIVDDSEMTARLIEAELKGKGFEIIVADSVDKATRLSLRKQSRPDLILLDVNMPNVDGPHFCRFIKGNSLFKGIKVVLCSGMEVERLKATAAQCGADGFVPKDAFLSKWVLEQIEQTEKARGAAAGP